ncbi:leucine-rich repeat transmembrane neuronal protein 2 isoform X2 [Ooceraea biroi]|uniref:leucine-rich repeat transmembrane neuronal protein 2 isoform X2 n=1 Tax=Ooceraea biroi TaxID=2015173 RepID=UPI0005BBCB6A|nr:leucine-rich repeat transmembrane neuronal protein 2 isoform X2 [Ooceraea biroi]
MVYNSYTASLRNAMEAGLSQLKYLNLSANTISEIGLNAFTGLSELMVLDLSHNHLYYLLPDIFISTTNLRILRLSKNNFDSHIPKLECPWLTELSLDSCEISHVPTDTFNGLSYLQKLDLSNNLMIQLDTIALDALQFLRKLSIEGNPWSCDKLTYDLQMYLAHRNVQYQAICAKGPEPKKFEKMIAYSPRIKYEKYRPVIKSGVRDSVITTRKNVVSTPTRENAPARGNATDEGSFAGTLNALSPYWFFTIGFLLGNACGIFTCYIWLTQKISCCRGCRARDIRRRGSDTQRISLLQNLWQLEDSALDESGTTSCPGTPPPPYREVMLRPGLYRNPSVTTNLNNNFSDAAGAGYS